MDTQISRTDRVAGALYGLYIGDALAMPVHWYYDTKALRQDYGEVRDYLSPKNPHPDSILWRSFYKPAHPSADILHDQARYWGKKGIHYHQFLEAGENTLNVQLAAELLDVLGGDRDYSPQRWLEHFVSFLTTPGNHRDTYAEEYLRHFFSNYAQGVSLLECGRQDEHHIGGLSLMLPLVLFFADQPRYARQTGLEHLGLTHGGPLMKRSGALVVDLILELIDGVPMLDALTRTWQAHTAEPAVPDFLGMLEYPDAAVVGRHFSSACYVEQALPATLYLAAKYHQQPAEGLIANTMCGGDNCGRGAVLGALLGAASGPEAWPLSWRCGLKSQPPAIF